MGRTESSKPRGDMVAPCTWRACGHVGPTRKGETELVVIRCDYLRAGTGNRGGGARPHDHQYQAGTRRRLAKPARRPGSDAGDL